MINRKFENYRETSHNPGAIIKFYNAKQLFYDHSMEKYTFNNFTLQQFAFLLENGVKSTDQTVHVFHLRLCRLLEGPKCPIKTESILGKTPYRGASSNLEHNGAPGSAPESYLILKEKKWCVSSVLRDILMTGCFYD